MILNRFRIKEIL